MDSSLRPAAAAPRSADLGLRDAPQPSRPVQRFAADRPDAGDAFGQRPEAALLAELVLHKDAETPMTIGLFGAPGAGKTGFMAQMTDAVTQLAAAAAQQPGPFESDVVVVPVDAAGDEAPEALLRDAVVGTLARSHPKLAAELDHAGADPLEAKREADTRHDEARRRLDAERETLTALTGREATLVDAVIDAPGSLVDAYARSRRTRIERMLRQFGFRSVDPVASYKDLVREAAEESGPFGRIGLSLRALWAYKGQTRLIVTAVILFGLAWTAGVVRGDQTRWLAWLRDFGDRVTSTADWLQAHLHWLGPIETLLLLLGVLALLIDVMRAARFVLPLARGLDLLQQDLDGRRRDLGSQIAHQTRRVDALATELEAASAAARDADRRAMTARTSHLPAAARPAGGAAGVFRALEAAMHGDGHDAEAPRRLIVTIDGLDQRSSAGAAEVLSVARRLLGRSCVLVVAADRSHLLGGFGDTDPARANAAFARCIQLAYRVGAADQDGAARRAYAGALMGPGASGEAPHPPVVDATRSALDQPYRPREAETVAALAPFAGETPRAIKRYVNLYRVARADPRLAGAPAPVFTALALALAVDAHGFPEDVSALERASQGETAGPSTILRDALAAAREASGMPVELAQAKRALEVAGHYTDRMA